MNSISAQGLSLLQPELIKLTNLQALDMSLNGLDIVTSNHACVTLAHVFSNLPHLRRLDLGGNRTKDRLETILSVLSQGLEFLGLCGCTVTENDLRYLQRSHHVSTLQELDLSSNTLHALRMHEVLILLSLLTSSLTVLELEHCHITADGLTRLNGVLPNLQCLQYLNLKNNSSLNTCLTQLTVRSLVEVRTFRMLKMSLPADVVATEDVGEPSETVGAAFRLALQLHIRRLCLDQSRPPFSVWLIV